MNINIYRLRRGLIIVIINIHSHMKSSLISIVLSIALLLLIAHEGYDIRNRITKLNELADAKAKVKQPAAPEP
jgi:hypothetical protein